MNSSRFLHCNFTVEEDMYTLMKKRIETNLVPKRNERKITEN